MKTCVTPLQTICPLRQSGKASQPCCRLSGQRLSHCWACWRTLMEFPVLPETMLRQGRNRATAWSIGILPLTVCHGFLSSGGSKTCPYLTQAEPLTMCLIVTCVPRSISCFASLSVVRMGTFLIVPSKQDAALFNDSFTGIP